MRRASPADERPRRTTKHGRKQGRSFLDGRALSVSLVNLADIGKAFWEYRLRAEPYDVAGHLLTQNKVEVEDSPSRRAKPVRWRAYMSTSGQSHWMITKNVERYYETLTATQWLSPAQLRELQHESS